MANYPEAERLISYVLENRRRRHGLEHPAALEAGNALAAIYYEEGKYDRAVPLLAALVEAYRRLSLEEHRASLKVIANLASIHRKEGNYAAAERWGKPRSHS